jgi:5,6-dimethylbenzimidazole synthase
MTEFDAAFRERLRDLIVWRRDVRRFGGDPVPEETVARLLELASLAPSVGLSQPWRFVLVESPERRGRVRENFTRCNETALQAYAGERAQRYASLKLAGLDEAPVHLAVFADRGTPQGHGLGRRTMPEMAEYSAVMAIHTLWLVARAEGLGLGWVSILDPAEITRVLEVPSEWIFLGYFCLGFPQSAESTPELERQGWEQRQPWESFVLRR